MRADRLLVGDVRVRRVQLVERDPLELQPPQAALAGRAQVLRPRVAAPLARAVAQETALGRDHEVVGVGVQRLRDQVLAHLGAVGVRGVDQVDVELDRSPEDAQRLVAVARLAPDALAGDPHGAEAEAPHRHVAAEDELAGWLRVVTGDALSIRRITVLTWSPSSVGHPAADLAQVPLAVVLDAPQVERPAAVPERVCGTRVAVERQPDAAGIDERAAPALAGELEVAVAEDDHRRAAAREQLFVVRRGLRRERLHVGTRRCVAEERLAVADGLAQGIEASRFLGAELRARVLACTARDERVVRRARPCSRPSGRCCRGSTRLPAPSAAPRSPPAGPRPSCSRRPARTPRRPPRARSRSPRRAR